MNDGSSTGYVSYIEPLVISDKMNGLGLWLKKVSKNYFLNFILILGKFLKLLYVLHKFVVSLS